MCGKQISKLAELNLSEGELFRERNKLTLQIKTFFCSCHTTLQSSVVKYLNQLFFNKFPKVLTRIKYCCMQVKRNKNEFNVCQILECAMGE